MGEESHRNGCRGALPFPGAAAAGALASLLIPLAASAQITPTNGLKGLGSLVNGGSGSCTQGLCSISGGSPSGNGDNLFHRFDSFDTRGNILRVTIEALNKENVFIGVINQLGTFINKPVVLNTTPGNPANLVFLSPGGIWVGQGARFSNQANLSLSSANTLDFVGGSFDVFTTTDVSSLNAAPTAFLSRPGLPFGGGGVAVDIGAGGTLTIGADLLLDAPGGNVILVGDDTSPPTIAAPPTAAQPGTLFTTADTTTLLRRGALALDLNLRNEGTLGGAGTLSIGGGSGTVTNRGTIAPGEAGATGLLTLDGNLLQPADAAGGVSLELAAADDFDRLDVTGSADLEGGSIDVVLLGGFLPSAGAAFPVITTGSGLSLLDGVSQALPAGIAASVDSGLSYVLRRESLPPPVETPDLPVQAPSTSRPQNLPGIPDLPAQPGLPVQDPFLPLPQNAELVGLIGRGALAALQVDLDSSFAAVAIGSQDAFGSIGAIDSLDPQQAWESFLEGEAEAARSVSSFLGIEDGCEQPLTDADLREVLLEAQRSVRGTPGQPRRRPPGERRRC